MARMVTGTGSRRPRERLGPGWRRRARRDVRAEARRRCTGRRAGYTSTYGRSSHADRDGHLDGGRGDPACRHSTTRCNDDRETRMILDDTYTLANGVPIPKLGLGTWFIDDAGAAEAIRQAT